MKTFFFFFGDRLKNFCEDLFFFFFWRALALVSLVLGLGLEHSCPWPREVLSLALALASDFFCVLGLEASSLVSSTPPLVSRKAQNLSNSYLFLQKLTFTKFFFKHTLYCITLIHTQNLVRAFQSSVSAQKFKLV